jgi:hypothetical protein
MSYDASLDATPESFVARLPPSQCLDERVLSVEPDGWVRPPAASGGNRCVASLRMLAEAGFDQPMLLVRHALNTLLNEASQAGETGCHWRLYIINCDVDAMWTAVVGMVLAGETGAGRATVTTATVASPSEIHLIDIEFADFNDPRIHRFLEEQLAREPRPDCQLRLVIDAVTAVNMKLPPDVAWILERAELMRTNSLTVMPNELYTLTVTPPADAANAANAAKPAALPTIEEVDEDDQTKPAAASKAPPASVVLEGIDVHGLRRISDFLVSALGQSASCRLSLETLEEVE